MLKAKRLNDDFNQPGPSNAQQDNQQFPDPSNYDIPNEELVKIIESSGSEEEKLTKIKELFEKSPKLNVNLRGKRNDTPLHIAVRKKELKIIEFLVKNGAKTDIKNNRNVTPLDIAKRKDIRQILESHVQPSQQAPAEEQSVGRNQPQQKKSRGKRKIGELVDLSNKENKDPDCLQQQSSEAKISSRKRVRSVASKDDILSKRRKEFSSQGHEFSKKQELEHPTNYDTPDEELINIIKGRDLEEEKLTKITELFEKNPKLNVNLQGERNDTPLHIAVRKKELKIIEFLVKNGAKIDIKNSRGITPLDIAKRKDIRQILESHVQPSQQASAEEQSVGQNQPQQKRSRGSCKIEELKDMNPTNSINENKSPERLKDKFIRAIVGKVKANAFKEFLDKEGKEMFDIICENNVRRSMSSILSGAGAKAKDAFQDLYHLWFDTQGHKRKYLDNFTDAGFTLHNLSGMLSGAGSNAKEAFQDLHNLLFDDKGEKKQFLNDFIKIGFKPSNLSNALCGSGARATAVFRNFHKSCFNREGGETRECFDYFIKKGLTPANLSNMLSKAGDNLEKLYLFCSAEETKKYLDDFLNNITCLFTLDELSNILHGAGANICSALKDFHDVCFNDNGSITECLNDFITEGFNPSNLSSILAITGVNASSVLKNFHGSCFTGRTKEYLNHLKRFFTPDQLSQLLGGAGTKTCSIFEELHDFCFDKNGIRKECFNDLIENHSIDTIIDVLYGKFRKDLNKVYRPYALIGLRYQQLISQLLLHKIETYESNTSISVEDSAGGKFDDITLRCEDKIFRIQVKYILDAEERNYSINYIKLFPKSEAEQRGGRFSVNKYFNSFLSQQDTQTNYFVICTNASLDLTEKRKLEGKERPTLKFDEIDPTDCPELEKYLRIDNNNFHRFSKEETTKQEFLNLLKVNHDREYDPNELEEKKKDFLNKMIFITDMPDRKELTKIIKDQIKNSEANYTYCELQERTLDSIRANKEHHIKDENTKECLRRNKAFKQTQVTEEYEKSTGLRHFISGIIYEDQLFTFCLWDMFTKDENNKFSIRRANSNFGTSSGFSIHYRSGDICIKTHAKDKSYNINYSDLFPSERQEGKGTFSINRHIAFFTNQPYYKSIKYCIIWTDANLNLTEEEELRAKERPTLKFDKIDSTELKKYLPICNNNLHKFSKKETEKLKGLIKFPPDKKNILSKLVFAHNQPNEEELRNITKNEMEEMKVAEAYDDIQEINLRLSENPPEEGYITKKKMKESLKEINPSSVLNDISYQQQNDNKIQGTDDPSTSLENISLQQPRGISRTRK